MGAAMSDGYVWRADEPLHRHVPRRVGGRCDAWVVVHERDALSDVMARISDEGMQWTPLGEGSRVLVRDGGLAGAVVRLGTAFSQVRSSDGGWEVGAAVPTAQLAHVASGTPLSKLALQPGSAGASWALDPGWGPWISEVEVWSRGAARWISWAALSKRSKPWILRARVRAKPEGRGGVPVRRHPWAVFQDLPRADLDRVLRLAGLAGTRLRRVLLPEAEPASLVNLGGGTSREIDLLLRSIVDRLKREQGVELASAVTWLGRT